MTDSLKLPLIYLSNVLCTLNFFIYSTYSKRKRLISIVGGRRKVIPAPIHLVIRGKFSGREI